MQNMCFPWNTYYTTLSVSLMFNKMMVTSIHFINAWINAAGFFVEL